jgi:hypothetical protein
MHSGVRALVEHGFISREQGERLHAGELDETPFPALKSPKSV